MRGNGVHLGGFRKEDGAIGKPATAAKPREPPGSSLPSGSALRIPGQWPRRPPRVGAKALMHHIGDNAVMSSIRT